MLVPNAHRVGVCSWVKHKKSIAMPAVGQILIAGGGRQSVMAVVDEAHYRGSEGTQFLCCLGAHWFPPGCGSLSGVSGVGVGGCVLFEKCIVDASI